MAAKQKLRHRTEATPALAQTRDEVTAAIKELGDLAREKTCIQAEMNDSIAALQKATAEKVAPYDEKIEILMSSITAWCTANRDSITEGGKVKFADFITGKVFWRCNPPKVSIRGQDAVLALLEQNEALARFIRIKKEINKDAILNEADLFVKKPVPGLSIVLGKEFFMIEPHNQELPEV
ncbi:host-nuclease inhibitor Gam family protein [Snodgrassella sp. CFCC 13594]|uniref:host-nuclease inhibitor Gam family protein n=1 Tax=Snodgrassella sp. CFCC 13594 TaxID=1775559 RepID=UPI00082BEB15|nr:host-nuclease inhibitor Gam family protein [Snodgrassella sp. CFCC 13594]